MSPDQWSKYKQHLWNDSNLGVMLDVSRIDFAPDYLGGLAPKMKKALEAMQGLEKGEIANPDENRMVGHYWLRASDLAPSEDLKTEIDETVGRIRAFAHKVHQGLVRPANADRFTHFLVVGIGGSALGPQFVAQALTTDHDELEPHFVDNTDPDGIDLVLSQIGHDLNQTLVIIISKSGGTKETRNGLFEIQSAFERLALDFSRHAVAVTGNGSQLDDYAREHEFLEVFPMWDWVGGRTSEFSAVGLLPAALQGIDIGEMLEGAAAMDVATRESEPWKNPAALLAAMWYFTGNGKGDKQMVVLPYKDRLLLFSRYLQQLVMESIGKEHDLDGKVVNQGIAVYGNKGSTDQHAYVQQLRDGRSDFFVTFIEVLKDRLGESMKVEENVTAGDYLLGFYLGTRAALHEKGRQSITVTLSEVSARSVGMLIALYERTVGLYASLINVNAYHQPGVEAGKKAAGEVLKVQGKALAAMHAHTDRTWELEALASEAGVEDIETLFKVMEHMASNPDHGVQKTAGSVPWEATYKLSRQSL